MMIEVRATGSPEASNVHFPQITLTPTGSSADESLFLLQQFLVNRLEQNNLLETPFASLPLCIDLGVLGTKDHEQAEASPSDWRGRMIYPLRLYRSQMLLGPLYLSSWSNAPCPSCVERRWFGNRAQAEQVAFMQARQIQVAGHNPRLTPFALETIWQLLESLVRQQIGAIEAERRVYPFTILNLESLCISRSTLMKDSNCPSCALPVEDTREAAMLKLQPRPKRDISTFRLVKPADYPLPLTGLVNSTSGVLGTEIIPEVAHPLSTPVSGQLKVRSTDTVFAPYWSGHGNSYQESLTLGLLEGLERYAGLLPRGKQANVFASYEHLAPDALDPRECGLYQAEAYQHMPHFQPFTPERVIPWVWGYSFRQGRPLLVPEELVYYMEHRKDYRIFVHDSSNGCATGSCLEEAIFHGLLELIERDAFLLAWYARLSPPRIDPRSCCRPETLFVLEKIEKYGYDLYLLDTRLDIRIPSVVSVARRKEPGLGNIMVAAGCSLDPEEAVRGTLCEVSCYIHNLSVKLEQDVKEMRAMAHDYSKMTQVLHHGLLYGLPEMERHIEFLFQNPTLRSLEETYRDWATIRPTNQDLRDDLHYCLNLLSTLGMDVIVVDQTCPEQVSSGLKTVSVIVPGLMPIDFGWKRERVFDLPRLRTVPRTAGFRETDFCPDSSNSLPHPFP